MLRSRLMWYHQQCHSRHFTKRYSRNANKPRARKLVYSGLLHNKIREYQLQTSDIRGTPWKLTCASINMIMISYQDLKAIQSIHDAWTATIRSRMFREPRDIKEVQEWAITVSPWVIWSHWSVNDALKHIRSRKREILHLRKLVIPSA